MSYKVRWRKAVALSVFFHIFWGVAVGYMIVRETVSPPADEQVIELDITALANEASAEPEQQIAPLSLAEAAEEPETPQLTEPPLTVSTDGVDSELIPIKEIPSKSDTTTIVSSKPSMMGTPPIVLVRVDADNPPEVDRIGRKIVVVLRVKILKSGLPGKVEVVVPSGEKSINDAAVAAAKKWRFEPAKDREGNPVVCLTILSIPFMPK